MAEIPKLGSEVFYGSIDTPLPNWRDAPANDPNDEILDSQVSEEQYQAVKAILGFDPRELDEPSASQPISESARAKLSQLDGLDWIDYLLD